MCNLSTTTSTTTISSGAFNINYDNAAFGTGSPYLYAIWNVGVTPTTTGTYLIGLNFNDGVELSLNGMVYINTIGAQSSTHAPSMLYGMASSVSLIAGQTYPLTIQYCSSSGSSAYHTVQLLWTLPNLNQTTTELIPVFNATTYIPIVSSSPTFTAFINSPPAITTVTQSQTVVNTIQPVLPAVGNTQTTCPSIPYTRVTGTCAGCPVYNWVTGGSYTFVPAPSCSQAYVQVWGAAGQDGTLNYKANAFCGQYAQRGIGYGGYGGYTEAVINLVPNDPYTIVVGSGGNNYNSFGGGTSTIGLVQCGMGTSAGGGLSGLYDSSNNPWLIAGGGGGGGSSTNGGAGGGLMGVNSSGLYYGTGASTIDSANGVNTYDYQFNPPSQCIGGNYGSFIYSGGGGGLYTGGPGGESSCYAATTINTPLLSFWGAGGGSGYMCGQGGTQYGITLNGSDSAINRASPYFPGAGYPYQLIETYGNDGAVQITCFPTNGSTVQMNSTTYEPPVPQQTFGQQTSLVNTCPPYTVANTSNTNCQLVLPLIQTIPTTTSVCPSNRTFYVDQLNGNDTNSGLLPNSAWASTTIINTLVAQLFFNPGDTILFCRGDVYMRQTVFLDTAQSNNNVTLYPNCSVRFSSYVCNETTENVLPLFTLASILPQTPLVGWQTVNWPLLNGSSISVLMYNFSLLQSLSTAYLPPLTNRRSGVAGIWINSFPYQLARHPNTVDLSVWDYNHQLGTTYYEWMRTDPNDYINYIATGSNCYTPPYTHIAPGSWCNHIWNDIFAQNATHMNELLQEIPFLFNGANLFADGAQGYSSINLDLGVPYSYNANEYTGYLIGNSTMDCEAWYNLTVAPYFPSNITWGNPVFDAIPLPFNWPLYPTFDRAYITAFTAGFVECDGGRGGNFPPPGIPASVTNFSILTTGTQPTNNVEYAYNDAFILSNHYAFFDNPGEFYYDMATDCLYIVPYSQQHLQLLTATYDTFSLSQVSQTVHQGASTSFNLAFVSWQSLDISSTIFYFNNNYPYHLAQIIEIDTLEFVFGGTAAATWIVNLVFHHNILRGMANAASNEYGFSIATNNIIYNSTNECFNLIGSIVLVLNNTCAYTVGFSAVNTNGGELEIVRGNVVVHAGSIGLSLAGGNTQWSGTGTVRSTIAEFNWVDTTGQLGAQWALINIEEGIMRYNEITNADSGNWIFVHASSISQSETMSTVQNNMIVDNNIFINGSGAGIFSFASSTPSGTGFATVTNNLLIDAAYRSEVINTCTGCYSFSNNQMIMTRNYLPNLPSGIPYMLPPQVNIGAFSVSNTPTQLSVCHGLVDNFVSINGNTSATAAIWGHPTLSQFWNGALGGASTAANLPPLQLSELYTNINYQPTEYLASQTNLFNIQQYLASIYSWTQTSPTAQMAFGASNCTYYAEQQLALKRAQNCQARINSEPRISEYIYSLYSSFHQPVGMCWPPTGDRTIPT